MATDADENDMLTYTLWWGDSSDNLSKTDITATGRSGQSVILEKSGLSNDTRYWFRVVVSDGINETASGDVNEKTYCKGEYCTGGYYEYPTCTQCNGTGKITCTASGCVNGKIIGDLCTSEITTQHFNGTCPDCGYNISNAESSICPTCGATGTYMYCYSCKTSSFTRCVVHGKRCFPRL